MDSSSHPERVTHAAVIGGGTMGSGIAAALAESGAGVTVVDVDTEATIETLPAGLDLIVEAVPEQAELKRSVLARCALREPRLLASNTSGISIDELAAGLPAPDRFLGLHFFNPVSAMKLVEIVLGSRTGDAARARALALCVQLGKTSIVVRDMPGFASTRLGIALGLEAMRMVEDGVAAPADIDRAMELGYRHPMGPLKLTDLVGLDVRLDIARNLERTYGARYHPPQLLVDMVAAGHLGKKSGRGFYDWSSGEARPIGS
ncbi:MAG TPA: 3-hydroxyacyl-CoA dehydrogenase family protein [Candidatus Lustribacter sp.]|nr:3-hydroxyacyl-CoA dehydrogenase family protein [Candidatus Lustribacter sp.]